HRAVDYVCVYVHIIGDGDDVVGKVVQALGAIANGVHKNGGILVDDGFLAVVLLHVHADGQHPDNRYQRKANDRQADGNLDHGEGPASAECGMRGGGSMERGAWSGVLHSAFRIPHSALGWFSLDLSAFNASATG